MTLKEIFKKVLSAPYIQLKENAASYFAECSGETLTLLFQGSNGKEDWKNNFDFPAKPYREMKDIWFVHRGFLRVFKTIEPYIAPMIADKNVRRIVIAGYSHGAALALLCHEYTVFHRPDIAPFIDGYGFGCPRVVWWKPNKHVLGRFARFTVIRNCRDLVTHVPPRLFGFRHVGTMRKIGDGAAYGPIKSHFPENYLTELDKLQRRHGI